ncbi:hypothetical protein GC197_01475 [bacterium]|nr:hypothetical protein [bacterium]
MIRLSVAMALLLLCLLGCYARDDSGLPKRVPVKVVVLYEGKPVERATVTFGDAKIRGAVGNTDKNGEVRLWTYQPGDGVIPGNYSVAIRKLEVLVLPNPEEVTPEEFAQAERELNRALNRPPKYLLPKKYSDPKTSELTAEVVDGGENEFTFKLEN